MKLCGEIRIERLPAVRFGNNHRNGFFFYSRKKRDVKLPGTLRDAKGQGVMLSMPSYTARERKRQCKYLFL